MKIAAIIILAILGGALYVPLNVFIRRLIAKVISADDYDEDVDGLMTKEEKKAAEERKVLEKEKLKIGMKAVFEESKARFIAIVIIGVVLGGLVGYQFGLSFETIIYFLFFMLLTVIAFVDMATMEIPPMLNLAILVLGIISIFVTPEITIVQRLIGLVCVSGFMTIFALIMNGFGFGDIKLMAAAGFLLGWKGILTSFIFGLFMGAAIGIILMDRKKKGGREHMPFGPSLCAGLVAATLFGSQLVDWYIHIIKLAMPNTFPQ